MYGQSKEGVVTESELQAKGHDRRQEEVAQVAKQLAEYGFYVMDALLPDDLQTTPAKPRSGQRQTN